MVDTSSMATGQTALPSLLPIASASAPLDDSSSNMSSPLSDVEDKDADSDSMEIDTALDKLPSPAESPDGSRSNGDEDEDEHGGEGDEEDGDEEDGDEEDEGEDDDNDDDSNLSDVGSNDSEAETERLYDSPIKRTSSATHPGAPVGPSPTRRSGREHVAERSPAKAGHKARPGRSSGRDAGDEEEASASDSSVASTRRKSKPIESTSREEVGAGTAAGEGLSETRKRKRSPAVDPVEGASARKRIVSVPAGAGSSQDNTALGNALGAGDSGSADPRSGDASDEGEANSGDVTSHDPTGTQSDAGRTAANHTSGTATRSKRNGARRQKGTDEPEDSLGPAAQILPKDVKTASIEHGDEDGDIEGDGEGDGDGDGEGDGGEGDIDLEGDGEGEADAEITHKDEEELERRKAARDFIHEFERQFAKFRDQYYEERIRILNEEEAMLLAPEPTHPEFLAMMQPVEARRDETQRITDTEYRLSQESLHRWAVARRAQVLSQYYQSVRDSREKALEELGSEWYRIQQLRRRHANTTPDFGLPFPDTRAKALKQAVAYNKEVSILSGIAKHQGFPAAPDIIGASAAEIEEDLDEIAQARNGERQNSAMAATFQDFGAIPNERSLGAAGEEFLKQTPWANPNHPAHQMPKFQNASAHIPQEEVLSGSPVPGPSGRKHSQATGRPPQPFSSNSATNGSPAALPRPSLATSRPPVPISGAS